MWPIAALWLEAGQFSYFVRKVLHQDEVEIWLQVTIGKLQRWYVKLLSICAILFKLLLLISHTHAYLHIFVNTYVYIYMCICLRTSIYIDLDRVLFLSLSNDVFFCTQTHDKSELQVGDALSHGLRPWAAKMLKFDSRFRFKLDLRHAVHPNVETVWKWAWGNLYSQTFKYQNIWLHIVIGQKALPDHTTNRDWEDHNSKQV